jgi:hypothetical protein
LDYGGWVGKPNKARKTKGTVTTRHVRVRVRVRVRVGVRVRVRVRQKKGGRSQGTRQVQNHGQCRVRIGKPG